MDDLRDAGAMVLHPSYQPEKGVGHIRCWTMEGAPLSGPGKITRSNQNLLILSNKIVLLLFVETDMKSMAGWETTTDLNKTLLNVAIKDSELHT